MTTVALAGDWHGGYAWASGRLMSLGSRGIKTVFHLGDFGLWPGRSGTEYLLTIEKVCAKYGDITIYVTFGNHEDWDRIVELQQPDRLEERDELGPLIWLTDHIAAFPRDPAGHRFTLGGRSFVSMGGAGSIDYPSREQGANWWPDEMIPAHTAAAVAADGYADVMLSHDSPGHPYATPKVQAILDEDSNSEGSYGWTDRGLAWAALSTERVTEAFEGVKPRLLVHGHMHVADETRFTMPGCDYETHVVALSHERGEGNIRLLNLDTLQVIP